MCPVLRRLTRDSEMAESHWFLPGPGQRGMAPPLRYAPPRAEAGVWHQAQHGGQVWAVTELCAAHPPPGKTSERRPGESSGDPPATRSHNQTYISLPDAIGAIRGTFVEGRTGRQHEWEEGAETVIRFSPLIVFPAGGPGPWYVLGRIIPRRRVSLCSRARGKEEFVE